MSERDEDTSGVIGNFLLRRRIEREAEESRRKAVGRIMPEAEERSITAPVESEFHSKGRLMDEEG